MDCQIELAKNRRTEALLDPGAAFGRVRTDHIFQMNFADGAWDRPHIGPLGSLDMTPDTLALHYGQEIFEGMKAYRREDGGVNLFRPDENAKRFHRGAERLQMAPVAEGDFVNAVCKLVDVDSNWVPPSPGSLYIRPTLIATEQGVAYRSSNAYKFFVILMPVGDYYGDGTTGVTVLVEEEMSRAAPGGVGNIKCAGNYAAALAAQHRARSMGANDAMWLDAKEKKYIEEVGTMNLMFYYAGENRLATPKLTGTILPGITRMSLLEMARDMGVETEETLLAIDDVIEDIKSGKITEVFGCGTAVVVSPVAKILYKGEEVCVAESQDSMALKLRKRLVDIQFGRAEDKFGWIVRL